MKNDLAFDIGANIGKTVDDILVFYERVVAVEPNPDCATALRLKYANNPNVIVEPVAVGAQDEIKWLSVCDAAPTISTFNERWKTGRFLGFKWNRSVQVPVVTLDSLVAKYGIPLFCKVDTEGWELEVFKGLSTALPMITFEFASETIDLTQKCVDRLAELSSDYRFKAGWGDDYGFSNPSHKATDIISIITGSAVRADYWGNITAFIE